MQAKFVLILLTIGKSLTTSLSSPVYTVIGPSKLRPNIPFHVSASAHNLKSTLEMSVGIEGRSDDGGYHNIRKNIRLNSGETRILNFEIGEWSPGNYSLIVVGKGGMNFRNQSTLTYEYKSYSVFVQTDKAIYKPGQLVQFRVLVVNPYLLPSAIGAITIFITDAKQNRIKQWDKVSLTKGITSGNLSLSDQPVQGEWTIYVDIHGHIFQKSFTVAEYVLPKFEVKLSLPQYITYNQPECVATVTAKYTYGKAVKGHVKLFLVPFLTQSDFFYQPSMTEVEINGLVYIPLNLVRDLNLHKSTSLNINVMAEVEDYLTKKKYNTSTIITIQPRDIKIEPIKSSNSFKPGLKYTTQLKLSYDDGTPVNVENDEQIVLYYGEFGSSQLTVPNNGLINVDFYPPSGNYFDNSLLNLLVKAKFREIVYDLYNVEIAQSPSNNFLQVVLCTETPIVDKDVELEINATEPLTHLVYEVLGRGDIIFANSITVLNAKTFKFSIPVTYKMAPTVRIVVFYVRPENNEIVTDSVNFEVDGVFRTHVNVSTSTKETQPGALINVTVSTTPNALVGLLGIDQRVLLLKSGNDITQSDVLTELETYDHYVEYTYDSFYGRKKRSLWWSGSVTAHEVFIDSGLKVLTNGHIYENTPPSYLKFRSDSDWVDEPEDFASSKTLVRKHFPETWIWDLVHAESDGKLSLNRAVPDTITSWIVSAFAIDEVTGLGIAPAIAKVTAFKPFFVKLNLPYSVIKSESLYLEVIVYNYDKNPIETNVTLENLKGDFEFIIDKNKIPVSHGMETKTVQVPAEDGVSVQFLITPKKLGFIDLKVTAISDNAYDSIVQQLLVKPKGVPQFFNKAIFVDLRDSNSKPMKKTVQILVPVEAVHGSTTVTLSAIGDLLGPTVNNLDKLLRLPRGCGEQNMLNFVPNIVITKYLERIGRLTNTIQIKSMNFLECGYQRELTYRRKDGSFSAFGNNDKNGSTWLTAFVVRSFHQAEEFMEIDKKLMSTALKWLSKQQKYDGSFNEPGEVHHQAMQGGTGSKNTLTAYVLLAFLENQVQKTFRSEMDKAMKFLHHEVMDSQDPYFLSIACYAFHLANHTLKDVAFQKLISLSTTGFDTMHWQKTQDESCHFDLPQSQDVEMTAYALLTYSVRGDVTGALPILRWLISQQNEFGGYSSTQDTVVGIQALAALGMMLSSPSVSITITYSSDSMIRSLNINSDNAMILQNAILSSDTESVNLKAEGFGVGIVQVTWSYNIESTEGVPAFVLKPSLGNATTDDYLELDICTSYKEKGASNMAVMEVGLPSGFQADVETLPSINHLQKIKRFETQDDDSNVVVYFDEIGWEEMCVHVPAHRNFKVAHHKPVPVHVYDYYDLSKSARIFYEPKIISLCNDCEGDDCEISCNELTDGVNFHGTNLIIIILASLFAICYTRRDNLFA